ncbi:MAG: pirin family protein [Parvularculaceae bacterium]
MKTLRNDPAQRYHALGGRRVSRPLAVQLSRGSRPDQSVPAVRLCRAVEFRTCKGSYARRWRHPHKGFETVTIVFDGEVSHRDSTGGGGAIRCGEVQWMTAGSGVLHEEFHSPGYSKTGGPFRMVQLWVNLPARDKLTPPRYQAITRDMIPEATFDGGRARIVAGAFNSTIGRHVRSRPSICGTSGWLQTLMYRFPRLTAIRQ